MSYRKTVRETYLKGDVSISNIGSKNIETNVEKEEKPPVPSTLPPIFSPPAFGKQSSEVGFASLPNQVYRKAIKRGFDFNLMVVGESGLGKSTLINSLFLTEIYNSDNPGPSLRTKKTTQIERNKVLLREGGVQLRLTVIDTPGFGDAIDNTDCWEPIVNFIDQQYENYLNIESQLNRSSLIDNRIHCCLYFIAPTGHSLKTLDIEFMKHLHLKVNIVPIIAKADTLTHDEAIVFKKTILNEIIQNKINIYDFPIDGDEEHQTMLKKLKDKIPFAVIGSNSLVDVQGKKVRGRMYPWGTVEVDNLAHNDFIALRNMIISQNMQDLKDITSNVHYENFRYGKLSNVTTSLTNKPKTSNSTNPMVRIEEERKEHVEKMKKMEAEMQHVFEMKVKEKLQKLKDTEADLQRRSEQMKKYLEQQEAEIVERFRNFDAEQNLWEEQNKAYILDDSSGSKNKKKVLNF